MKTCCCYPAINPKAENWVVTESVIKRNILDFMTDYITTCREESLLTLTVQVCKGSRVLSLLGKDGIFVMRLCCLEGDRREVNWLLSIFCC